MHFHDCDKPHNSSLNYVSQNSSQVKYATILIRHQHAFSYRCSYHALQYTRLLWGNEFFSCYILCPPTRSTLTKSTPTKSTPNRSTSHAIKSTYHNQVPTKSTANLCMNTCTNEQEHYRFITGTKVQFGVSLTINTLQEYFHHAESVQKVVNLLISLDVSLLLRWLGWACSICEIPLKFSHFYSCKLNSSWVATTLHTTWVVTGSIYVPLANPRLKFKYAP